MNFRLSNEDRSYLGLPRIEEDWLEIVLDDETTIFRHDNKVVKYIYQTEISYLERTYNECLSDDGLYLLSKTKKGNRKKLTASSIKGKQPTGTYFEYAEKFIWIGNYTSQKTFYTNYLLNSRINNFEELRFWLDDWKTKTTPEFQERIDSFSSEKRMRIKFKEGDYFSIKYDRGLYGFGRVLYDLKKHKESPIHKMSIFMGKPVLIQQFAIMSNIKTIDICKLAKAIKFPSHFIMDNNLFYGNYEIFDHKEVEDNEMDFPILYLKSSMLNIDDVYFFNGSDFKVRNKSEINFIGDLGQRGIGFDTNIDLEILNKVIFDNSLDIFWKTKNYFYGAHRDLRNPLLKDKKEFVFNQFDIL